MNKKTKAKIEAMATDMSGYCPDCGNQLCVCKGIKIQLTGLD